MQREKLIFYSYLIKKYIHESGEQKKYRKGDLELYGSGTFMNISKYFFKGKILCLKKHRTLGVEIVNLDLSEGGIPCIYAFLGIC